MRQLFVTILLFSIPTDPLDLWEHHQASLSDDFLCRAKRVDPDVQLDEHILNSVMLDIEGRLQKHGKSLEDYPGMPIPKHIRYPYEEPRLIQNELDYSVSDMLDMVRVNVPLLNADQLIVFNTVMKATDDSAVYPKVFFVDGPGGTGKHSFIIHC